MKFENTFVVQAPIEDVWETLMDVERVAPCMPGAEVLEQVGDDTYKVAVKVKLGPMSMQYRGQVEIVERDADGWQAKMRAKAKEARGQGTADAHIDMGLAEEPEGTRATITTELQLSGKAAAMGQGVIGDVTQKLTEMFAVNLAAMLTGEQAGVVSAPGGGPEPAPAGTATATAQVPAAEATTPPRQAATDRPPEPPRTALAESSLPAGEVMASVIAGRLSNPRTLAIAVAALAALFGLIGYAVGRKR